MALLQSPLHDRHVALGAKFAEFGGWSMPLEYPSGVVKEHTAVREAVGVFDVSHLGKAMVSGPGAAAHVNATLSNDLGKIEPGKAQYTLCCDDTTGGIVDDLIAYFHDDEHVLLVPNAANTAEVVRRLAEGAPEGVKVVDHHTEYAVLAVQGTRSDEVLAGRRPARRPRLHVVRRGRLRRDRGGRVPDRLHRRARVRADRRQRGGRRAVGPADGGGGGARHPRVRPRRPRHAAHRDGLPAPRPGHQHRRHRQPGTARLGRRLEEGALLGARRAAGREGGRARSGCCAVSSPAAAASRVPG